MVLFTSNFNNFKHPYCRCCAFIYKPFNPPCNSSCCTFLSYSFAHNKSRQSRGIYLDKRGIHKEKRALKRALFLIFPRKRDNRDFQVPLHPTIWARDKGDLPLYRQALPSWECRICLCNQKWWEFAFVYSFSQCVK